MDLIIKFTTLPIQIHHKKSLLYVATFANVVILSANKSNLADKLEISFVFKMLGLMDSL